MEQIGSNVPAVAAEPAMIVTPNAPIDPANPGGMISPQRPAGACPSCGAASARSTQMPTSFVYSIGKIEARYPRSSVEKEMAQVIGRAETAKLTNHQAIRKILAVRENRYLARQLCWVMITEGQDAHILVPRDPSDYDLLVEALRPSPSPLDIDVAIGLRGPTANPDMCNGLTLPILMFDVLYSFDRNSLLQGIPRDNKVADEQFTDAAAELLHAIVQLNDSAGASDRDRALNYLAVRYPEIYVAYAQALAGNFSMPGVKVLPSTLSGSRKIVDVVFPFTNRSTDVTEKKFVRVDVTDEFPFLVRKMSPYYDR
jgi:PatG C-terminal